MTRALTPMQARVLAVITAAIAQTGRPPTTREIATAVGVRSLNAVAGHMWALERKGYVVRDRNVARGVRVIASDVSARVDKDRAVVLRGATACGRPAVFMPVTRAGETRRAA